MGLLTSTDTTASRNKLGTLIRRCAFLLEIIVYVAGIGWFVGAQWPAFNGRTYFSENALLPGLVHEEFHGGDSISNYVRKLRALSAPDEESKREAITKWIEAEFPALNLEVYSQNFTILDALDPRQKQQRRNVFGIVRTSRGASLEGMVVATAIDSHNIPGIALLLAMASFWRDKVYWAKDIIFLFCAEDVYGARAWLSGYHEMPIDYLPVDSLKAHSGLLQAGIGIDFRRALSGRYSHINIAYNMVNGQLPNLDLVNLADRLVEKEGLIPTIHFRENAEEKSFRSYTQEGLKYYTETSLLGVQAQARGRAEGVHSVFGQFGIEAVLLQPWDGRSRSQYGDFTNIGRIVEGMFRSVNNLLERFHQSFFFYILPSTKRYISIANYMPALGLILLAPLLKACCLWAELQLPPEPNGVMSIDEKKAYDTACKSVPSMLSVVPAWVAAHTIGGLFYYLPWTLRVFAGLLDQDMDAEDFNDALAGYLLAGCAALSVVAIVAPFALSMRNKDPSSMKGRLLLAVALLELALLLGTVGVMNFSLGYCLACVTVPVFTFFVRPSKSKVWFMISSPLILLLNPLIFLATAHCVRILATDKDLLLVDLISNVDPSHALRFHLPEIVFRVVEAIKTDLVTVFGQAQHFDAWLMPLVAYGLLPIWTLFWNAAASVA